MERIFKQFQTKHVRFFKHMAYDPEVSWEMKCTRVPVQKAVPVTTGELSSHKDGETRKEFYDPSLESFLYYFRDGARC